MILLVGKSAAGKDRIRTELNKIGIPSVVTYTTRPKRNGEVDGVSYHFVDKSQFRRLNIQGAFIETTSYNVATGETWYYGSAYKDLKDNAVMIVNPDGLKVIKDKLKNNAISFLITASEETILSRKIKRGDNPAEAKRRAEADNEDFKDIESYIDFSFSNDLGLTPTQLAKLILDTYLTIKEAANE